MKKSLIFLVVFSLLFLSIFYLLKNTQPKIAHQIEASWSKTKTKKVPAKFKITMHGSYPAEIKEIGFLTKITDLILIGRVEKISPLKASINNRNEPMIYGDIAVVIEKIIKGEYNQPFITVRKYGGKISEEQHVDLGPQAEFKIGEKVVLFLDKPKPRHQGGQDVDDGIPHYNLYSGLFTKFAIIGDEAVRGPYELPLMPIEKAREEEKGLDTYLNEFLPVDESRFPLDKLISEIKANI